MWFDNKTTITPDEVTGSSDGAYYASGQGTSDDPYIINQPRHLYNLAWLQYLGTYNKDTDNDGSIDEVYFKVEGTKATDDSDAILDMNGWVLPPIGTKDNPFVGNFNGNNTIIKNLTVSNTFSDYGDNHPYYTYNNDDEQEVMSESTFTQPQIIGFFGVIGVGKETSGYEYTTNITVEGAAYTEANLVYDTYVDNITIQNNTENQELLAGLLAGYVNAPIIQSGVGYGKFNFASGTKNLSSSNTPSGATINGVSNYSLIGAYNPNAFAYSGLPTTDGGSGDGNDWGSSIDMMTLNRRMNYISAVSTFSVNSGSRYNVENSTYGYGGITSSSKEMYWNNTSTTYWYVKDGTFLPLSIDTDKAFDGGETTVTPSGSPSSYHTTSYYQTHTSEFELIADNNSGYLVGRTNGIYGDVRTRLQSLSSGLENSGVSSPYDGNIKVYTVDTTRGKDTVELYQKANGSVTTDKASDYGYTRFSSVMDNFDEFMNGYTVVHGFHMVQVDVNDSSNWASPSFKVKILGQSYTNYQFVKGCLNFSVAKKGYITTLVGSFYGQTGNNTMFDLFSIDRDSNHNIKSVTRIKKIYQDSNGNILYDPTDTTGLTLKFDFDNVTGSSNVFGSSNVNKAYYFELPVNPGDYAIGKSTDTDEYMAYLMYLDIGANAGDSGGGDEPSDTSPTEIDFVYYNSDKKLVKITRDGKYVNSEVVFQIDSGASGTIAFKRTYTDDTSIVYYYIPSASTITISAIGTEGNSSKSDSELEEN